MNDNEKYKNYLRDLGHLLKEMGQKASSEYDKSLGTEDEDYKLGYLMCFHRVLTLMQQQAPGFNISQEDISMKDFDADTDLF